MHASRDRSERRALVERRATFFEWREDPSHPFAAQALTTLDAHSLIQLTHAHEFFGTAPDAKRSGGASPNYRKKTLGKKAFLEATERHTPEILLRPKPVNRRVLASETEGSWSGQGNNIRGMQARRAGGAGPRCVEGCHNVNSCHLSPRTHLPVPSPVHSTAAAGREEDAPPSAADPRAGA